VLCLKSNCLPDIRFDFVCGHRNSGDITWKFDFYKPTDVEYCNKKIRVSLCGPIVRNSVDLLLATLSVGVLAFLNAKELWSKLVIENVNGITLKYKTAISPIV